MENIRMWCAAVVERVRFFPDHKAITQELTDHYMDHVRDLQRIGFDGPLAEQRALQAMGDAEEVGLAMDRAHKPWLGWLWLVSKWCLILCLGVTACLAVRGDWRNIQQDVQRWIAAPADYEADGMFFTNLGSEGEQFERLAWKSCDEVYERCGYTLRVPYAALWKRTYEGKDRYWVSAVMTAENWRFWERGPRFKQTVWLSASTGETSAGLTDISQTNYYMSNDYDGLFVTTFEINSSSYSEIPEWVELTCPYGEGFTFHIDWEGVQG